MIKKQKRSGAVQKKRRNGAVAMLVTIVALILLAVLLIKHDAETSAPGDSSSGDKSSPSDSYSEPEATPDLSYLENIQAPVEAPLCMAWAYRPIIFEAAPGVGVASPTWLYVEADENGRAVLKDVTSLGRVTDYAAYIQAAREQGLKIWVCVVSFDADLSEQILTDEAVKQDFLTTLAGFAETWQVDGICFDFEYMNPVYKRDYTELVRKAKENAPELTVAVAVTVIENYKAESNWYQCYDHKGLAEAADYIAIMTYQANSNYQTEGPVFPADWLEKKVIQELYEVPSNKILLGVPFYCYEYVYDYIYGEELVPADADVNALSLYSLRNIVETGAYAQGGEAAVKTWFEKDVYDELTHSYRLKFLDFNNKMHIIYYDSPDTLAEKAELIKKYNLGGVAVWVWSQGYDALWTALSQVVQEPDAE